MEIHSTTLLGNSSIGIFGHATDKYALFPFTNDQSVIDLAKETLKVPVIQCSLNNSSLNGIYSVGNSHHLLLPNLISEIEYTQIRECLPEDVEISIVDSTITALGNVIVTSDKVALVSPEFTTQEKKFLEDSLDVEVHSKLILGTTVIGSLLFRNANGILAHPLTSDDDLDWLEAYFKQPVDVVTVNRGTPYPRPGIIGNKNGILVGSDTTGPELMRIFDVLSN